MGAGTSTIKQNPGIRVSLAGIGRPFLGLALFAVALFLNGCSREPVQSRDGKPEPPLQASIKSSGDASKAGVLELRLTVVPEVETDDVVVTWQVPPGVTPRGSISETKHKVKANETLTFQAFVDVLDDAPRDIIANVMLHTPGGDIFGRSVPFHLGKPASKAPAVQGKSAVDSAGNEIVEIPGKTVIDGATR